MLLTPWRLILFRLYNLSLGRFDVFRLIFHRFAVKCLVVGRAPKQRYVQSSRFFLLDELKPEPQTSRRLP